jgi:hypothetical protein
MLSFRKEVVLRGGPGNLKKTIAFVYIRPV